MIFLGFQYVFKRIEKKYVLNEDKYEQILEGILPHMEVDKYGETTICNLYFDTEDSRLIQISVDKPVYKEKLRLRSYSVPKDKNHTVFLEIKKKFKKTVYKRRISMSLADAEAYMETGKFPKELGGNIPKEIDYMISYWNIKPKVFLAYDRTAYYSKENPELRITFDRNIRSRYQDLSLLSGDYGEPLLSEGTYIMEIKIPNAAPLWLARLLSQYQVFSQSFSKYGNVYIKHLLEDTQKEGK
ncbi:MAG: polyphosphate polymerase domain-containing protein [Eubacteriales bacterium]|nr:polyphosphate polymerase domain-containing protein [Eubacteriales bacterium]